MLLKFKAATSEYARGKRERPRFKKFGDPVSLQTQITSGSRWPLSSDWRGNTFADLAGICGEVCGKVPVVFHRDLPSGAKIKQLALTIRGERIFVVLMIEAPGEVLQKQFPGANGRVAGIDPGRKVALSLSTLDGTERQILQPSLARNVRFLKRLRRFQRKADRQRRAQNPECFDADGRWITGKRFVSRSRNLQKTERSIGEMQRHLANARLDFYHRSANDLLQRFDAVGVGSWRGRGNVPGLGKAKKAQNRKDYDHAISLFVAIMRYKAESQKHVFNIPEHGSTRSCSDCGEPTGPRGFRNLDVRKWVCSDCGAVNDRDFTAARAIARRTAEKLATKAHSPCSQDQSIKSPLVKIQRRRSPKDRTKVAPTSGAEVPVTDEAEAARPATRKITPTAANAAVPAQLERGAHASGAAVSQEDSDISLGGHNWQSANGGIPLAECAVEDSVMRVERRPWIDLYSHAGITNRG